MKENIERAQHLAAGLTLDRFVADRVSVYATVRCLEIISEASRRLEAEKLARYPQLDWRGIRDAGNIYRHVYDALELPLVWQVVTEALPVLLDAVEAEIERIEG